MIIKPTDFRDIPLANDQNKIPCKHGQDCTYWDSREPHHGIFHGMPLTSASDSMFY